MTSMKDSLMGPYKRNSSGDYEPAAVEEEEGGLGVTFADQQEEQPDEQDALNDSLVTQNEDEIMQFDDAKKTLQNFIFMSILFSANHGTIVACLSLATARLGSVGAWQSGLLYLFYTASAVFGATYIVKRLGGRNGMIAGMMLYCIYVSCFWIATGAAPQVQRVAALTGASFGGIGAGFLWASQGSYFTEAAKRRAMALSQDISESTSYLAGLFAFIYLSFEVLLRLLSSVLIAFLDWRAIFAVYTAVAVITTLGMTLVINYPSEDDDTSVPSTSALYKATAAVRLLWLDPKMKYMIGINAVFGFAGAFLNSYVNGQVVATALNDPDSRYVGALSAWMALVAACMSLLTARIARKGPVLITGSACFVLVAFPFVLQPDATMWNIYGLVVIYTLQGIGRATFESTLKATFADYFSTESAGAFGNIILQNGLAGAIGYILTFSLLCDTPSRYCIQYSDGSLHDVLTFELLVCITGVLAILGYWRASVLFGREQEDSGGLVEDEALVTNEQAEAA